MPHEYGALARRFVCSACPLDGLQRQPPVNGTVWPMETLELWSMLFVFMLATFVGFQVIQNVSRLLHTPLMSLTNAISAIAVGGSIIIAGEQKTTFSTILGAG